MTGHGAGVLDDQDLAWALERLRADDRAVDEQDIAAALELASGESTALRLHIGGRVVSVTRVDVAELPVRVGFVRVPVG